MTTIPENEAGEMKLQITEVVYPGKGLAKPDGCVVFVEGALQGEEVTAVVKRKRKRFVEAGLLEVTSPSEHRVVPECPLASVCPGCTYQHVDYAHEVRIKHGQLVNMLGHKLAASESVFDEPVAAPEALGYRNKITLHSYAGKGDVPALGYIGEDNRTVVDVERCPLAMAPLNELLGELRSDSSFMGSIKGRETVVLRCTEKDGAIGSIGGRGQWRDLTPGRAGRVLTESTCLGELSVPLKSFFQVNPMVADLLLSHVRDLVEADKTDYLVDLYSGVGVFAFAAASAGVQHVLGIERDRRAVKAARRNAAGLKFKNVEFVEGSSEAMASEALSTVNMAQTTVIVDPPRRGLDAPTLETLCNSKPRQLIYLSCAPDILVRDLGSLMAAGYSIEKCSLYDMFPRTSSFETVTVLRQ